jgi:hypothetical protein
MRVITYRRPGERSVLELAQRPIPEPWSDWYAAYFDARQNGSTPHEAFEAADRYMEDVKHVVVTPA